MFANCITHALELIPNPTGKEMKYAHGNFVYANITLSKL